MTRFIQLHILTSYPPSNLNRDDTGKPKTAIFGGQPRLRVSSQSLKRSWRTSEVFKQHLRGNLAERTRRLGSDAVFSHLLEKGANPDHAKEIAKQLAEIFGKHDDTNPGMIKQLAFISPEEKQAVLQIAERMLHEDEEKLDTRELAKSVLRKTDKAADLAMFGRMLADNPAYNREASVQVAHAITTHRVTVEDDFYTAVDDLNKHDVDAGAGFLGVQEFGAGLFYIYICIDYDLLKANLDGDEAISKSALSALVEAATQVSPGGKQNSFASHAYASYALAEIGTKQPRSLSAAFLKPIYSRGETDEQCYVEKSVAALKDFRERMDEVYGPRWSHEYDINLLERRGSLEELTNFITQGV